MYGVLERWFFGCWNLIKIWTFKKILEKMAPYKPLILEPFSQIMHGRMYSFFYPSLDGYWFFAWNISYILKIPEEKIIWRKFRCHIKRMKKALLKYTYNKIKVCTSFLLTAALLPPNAQSSSTAEMELCALDASFTPNWNSNLCGKFTLQAELKVYWLRLSILAQGLKSFQVYHNSLK